MAASIPDRGAATPGFTNVSFADNSPWRPQQLHATMLDTQNPRGLRVAALTPSGELLANQEAGIHAQLTTDPAAALGFVTRAGVYLDREQASAYRAGKDPLIPAAQAEDGQTIIRHGARVHSDLAAEWNSTLGYLTPDGRFLNLEQACAYDTPTEFRPPAYLKPSRAFEDCLGTIADVMAYRAERQSAFRQLLQDQIGITEPQAEHMAALVERDASTNRFEKSLAPKQRERLNCFFEGPYNSRGGPFADWVIDAQRNPETLLDRVSPAELAKVVTGELANLRPAPNFEASDRFIYPVVALLRLKQVGGSWRDVSNALDGQLHTMRAGDDARELYEAYGESIRGFAHRYGIELPLERSTARGEHLPPSMADELLTRAAHWRIAWKHGGADARKKVGDEIDVTVNALPGSGVTKIPLRIALGDYVSESGTLANVEKRLATHAQAMALQVQHGFNQAHGHER